MIYDMEKRQTVERSPGGAANDISFGRLIEQLRISCEIKPNETVTHLEVREGYIRYFVRTK